MSDRDEQLRKLLTESPDGISMLLKSAAHPAKIQMLALLTKGSQEFSDLMSYTKLSKTALANHLKRLVGNGLVQRVSRGEYALTEDGRELLKATALVYRNSVRRKEDQRKIFGNRYTRSLTEGRTLNRKVISKEAEYQPCWLSYTGAMAGSLKALGEECNVVHVGGYTGYAFLINVSKGVTCPSGPTALHPNIWGEIHKATENLGWTLEYYEYPHSYPEVEGKHTSKEIETARNLFEKIRQEIDERDRPVVLWGLVVPEYGIVNGYDGESYLPSTFRRLANQPEDPILFYDLKAPGCLEAFFFRTKVKPNFDQFDKEAVQRAVRFGQGSEAQENYVVGPVALDEWASVLEKLPEEKHNYHGNSYVAACVHEGRMMAGEFLRRLAKRRSSECAGHLLAAAGCYEQGAKLMEEFTRIFPFKFKGEMTGKDRSAAADLLRKVKPLEVEAVGFMKKALKTWKNQ